MPPRTTQQSHRPRVSDRTMVGTSPPGRVQALRHCTKNAATDGAGSGATQRSRTEPHTGLDVRQLPLPAEREKYFLLTSPFIEPLPAEREKYFLLTSPFIEPVLGNLLVVGGGNRHFGRHGVPSLGAIVIPVYYAPIFIVEVTLGPVAACEGIQAPIIG